MSRKIPEKTPERVNDTEKVNILMVDDQPAKLLSYEAILSELGENLIKANSGKEALEQLLKHDIAVVLLDVSMPELDGFELADMIRQHPRFQKLAILFISAVHLTELDRLKGYQRGAFDYISVPVNPELLRAKVSIFAELHRNARQLEVLNAELRRLSNSLIAAQDEERRHIARELHDGLGQDLAAAKMILEGIDPKAAPTQVTGQVVAEASLIIDHAIQQLRSMSHLLHPPLLDEVGLQSALQWYLDGLTKRSGISITLEVQPRPFRRLAPEIEKTVFRVIQEALTNVYRHSKARNAWVSLLQQGGRVVATVRDDGQGISERVADLDTLSIGVGISGMRQRVKEMAGELTLSNASPGTIVRISLPTRSVAAEDQAVSLPSRA
ncbi:MAG TPA: response regulator [Candidatus Acidoferrales bacterium]|nr:response regulator [Candidatus Acidoferrales bacterium]